MPRHVRVAIGGSVPVSIDRNRHYKRVKARLRVCRKGPIGTVAPVGLVPLLGEEIVLSGVRFEISVQSSFT